MNASFAKFLLEILAYRNPLSCASVSREGANDQWSRNQAVV